MTYTVFSLIICISMSCDRRTEIPQAVSQEVCSALDLGAAENLLSKGDNVPVDRVVTIEGIPHHAFFGWNEEGKKRSIGKLLGTERRLLLFQEFEGEAPQTSTKVTGLLRRYRDLPANPWEAVSLQLTKQLNWEIPDNAYILMEGFKPEGCP